MTNLDEIFRQTTQRQPSHAAILGPRGGASLSYGELNAAIESAATRLRAAGVRPGDCVGLHHPSNAQYIIITYAVWRLGGCVVPVPPELAEQEKAEVCRCLALDHVITGNSPADFLDAFRCGQPHDLQGATLVPVQSPRQHPPGFRDVNAAFIRFTSGTTGKSKGVVLSHVTIAERIAGANAALELGPADRVLWVLSMSYHFTVSIVAYLTYGATIVLPANHFAAAIVSAIAEHQATLLYASPLHYALLADYPEAAPLPSLRLAVSTTSSLDERVATEFARRCGRPISQALGIIECGLPCIHTDATGERWASIGRVRPPYELELADCGLGDDLREVRLRGPGFLDAYYEPWQTRDQIAPGGWFSTGDVGRVDGDGYLFLGGRTKDVISVMGMKFFPHEVERVLAAHPHVRAASVYATRDPRWGERAAARVVPAANAPADLEQQLRQYCRERLATYKVPEPIELVAELPKTASGKILHRV
jgi:long-chain acyl-CoA synthetase